MTQIAGRWDMFLIRCLINMTAFELYLIEKGFKVYRKVWNKQKQDFDLIQGYKTVSSLGNLFNIYIKGGIEILFGLGTVGTFPTILNRVKGMQILDGEKKAKELLAEGKFDELLQAVN